MATDPRIFVLGAGVSGLAAAGTGGFPVLEASAAPGGLCASYALHAATGDPVSRAVEPFSYRFDVGGGHWLHSRWNHELEFLSSLAPLRRYRRDAAVYFVRDDRCVPYPVQLHTDRFPPDLARTIAAELREAQPDAAGTMAEAHRARFGPTLDALFFEPFNRRYSAGLADRVLFREAYKAPGGGAAGASPSAAATGAAGYNSEFLYPSGGLGDLVERWSRRVELDCNRRVTHIDTDRRLLRFARGADLEYDALISTLPLNETLRLASVTCEAEADPWTSVLVMNIGGARGPRCPRHHWIYVPDSASGLHRVGFYGNVDPDFLPAAVDGRERVSMYVEHAFPGGGRPPVDVLQQCCAAMAAELQAWGFIADIEVLDATWVETAYTWVRPGSAWRAQATARLQERRIFPAGRFGMWENCGIADSMRNASLVGTIVRRTGGGRPFRLLRDGGETMW
jgi:protoporphyrinogen oxidase